MSPSHEDVFVFRKSRRVSESYGFSVFGRIRPRDSAKPFKQSLNLISVRVVRLKSNRLHRLKLM